MANGINTEQNKTMDIAKNALKKKMKNDQESKKILILISCLIVKELADKKVYRFKSLSIVQLDIVKDAMIT